MPSVKIEELARGMLQVFEKKFSNHEINNKIRALSPLPGAFTTLNGKRIKIFKSKVLIGEQSTGFGKISLLEKNRMAISCGEGELEIIEIQLANKIRMSM